MTAARAELEELERLAAEWERRERRRLYHRLYPDADTPQPDGSIIHARQRYPRHLEFFGAGATHRERCFMAANRVGKTLGGGGYELTAHLTGLYPAWWPGRRFARPIAAWAAGDTVETARDIIQRTLLGDVAWEGPRKTVDGTGLIPGERLAIPTWRRGVADAVDEVRVRHTSGGWSTLGLKSYDQGRRAFQGTGRHVIWLDEEPPMDVYSEALIRTMTVGGIVMLTFTPLSGMSSVVVQFLPAEQRPG